MNKSFVAKIGCAVAVLAVIGFTAIPKAVKAAEPCGCVKVADMGKLNVCLEVDHFALCR